MTGWSPFINKMHSEPPLTWGRGDNTAVHQSKDSPSTGITVFYAAGRPEGRLSAGSQVAVVGGGNFASQAAVWLSRGGALVTLLHRRGNLREPMSAYLIPELARAGVAIRDRGEITELHGDDGKPGAVTLKVRAPAVLFPLPRRAPVDRVARRRSVGTRRQRLRPHGLGRT